MRVFSLVRFKKTCNSIRIKWRLLRQVLNRILIIINSGTVAKKSDLTMFLTVYCLILENQNILQ